MQKKSTFSNIQSQFKPSSLFINHLTNAVIVHPINDDPWTITLPYTFRNLLTWYDHRDPVIHCLILNLYTQYL